MYLFHTGTWLEEFADDDLDNKDVYLTSLYWTLTTVTTVGYGDIHGVLPSEKIFNAVIMLIGVIAFSFVNGSLASILSNYDT